MKLNTVRKDEVPHPVPLTRSPSPSLQIQKNFYITAEPKAVFEAMATASPQRLCMPEAIVSKHGPETFKLSVFHYCKAPPSPPRHLPRSHLPRTRAPRRVINTPN